MFAELLSIVGLTLSISACAVVLASVIGIPAGAWLGLARWRGEGLIHTVVYTGMALPPVVVGLVLYILLSQSGPLAQLQWLFTPQAMIVAQMLLALPFVAGITMNAVEGVPYELRLQLRSLGASESQLRWTVLHEARRGLMLAVLAALGRSLSEVGAVLIVGGNIQGHTRVLTTAIVLETNKGEFGFALALGGTLLLIALAVNGLVVWIGRGGPVT